MAWLETRASPGKYVLAAMSMALGVAALFGVRSLTLDLANHLQDVAKQWVGADIIVNMPAGQEPGLEEFDRLRKLNSRARWTVLGELATMSLSKNVADPVSTYLQSIDPAVYPFYGSLDIKSGDPISGKLDSGGALLTDALMNALQVRVGDAITISRATFVVRGVISSEPGLVAAFSRAIPHVIVSRDGLNRTGLAGLGGTVFYRLMIRSPSDGDGIAFCKAVEAEFPASEVSHYTSVVRPINNALDWIAPAMNLLSMLCLVFGAIGIAIVAYLHLLQRLDGIAILKALGGTASLITRIYLFQVFFVAAIGTILGISLGKLVRLCGIVLTSKFVGLQIVGRDHKGLVAESIVISFSVAAAAAWLPLSQIRRVRPFILLRRDAGEKREPAAWQVHRGNRAQLAALGLGVLILIYLATALVGLFWLGLLSAVLITSFFMTRSAVYWPVSVMYRLSRRLPFLLRQAFSNLHRSRNQSSAVAYLLAVGAALSMCALEIQKDVGNQLLQTLPLRDANLLFGNTGELQRRELDEILKQEIGRRAAWTPIVWVTLSRAGTRNLTELRAARPATWIQKVWPVTCSGVKPAGSEIIAGSWRATSSKAHALAIDQGIASLLGVTVGTQIEFIKGGRELTAEVTAITRVPPILRMLYGMTLDCDGFERLDPVSYGGVYVEPSRSEELKQNLRSRFPGLWMAGTGEVVTWMQQFSTQAARGIQIAAAFCLLLTIGLFAAVTRILHSFRVYELAIMRVLGARTQPLLMVGVLEHFVLGGLAGFTGTLCGSVTTSLVLLFTTGSLKWIFHFYLAVLVSGGAALITAAMGMFGCWRVLGSSPYEVLRHQ